MITEHTTINRTFRSSIPNIKSIINKVTIFQFYRKIEYTINLLKQVS